MTIRQAAEGGHQRLRRPMWAPGNYVELDLQEGRLGPWMRLFFPPAGMEEYQCPMKILWTTWEGDDYEPYVGVLIEPRDGRQL